MKPKKVQQHAQLPYIDIVAAIDATGGIGTGTTIPWHLKADMKWFAELTTNPTHASESLPQSAQSSQSTLSVGVVMGRKTWESLPSRFQPLPQRINIILSNQAPHTHISSTHLAHPHIKPYQTLAQVLTYCQKELTRVFIIGGGRLYQQFLEPPFIAPVRYLYLTHIKKDFNCTVKFPAFRHLVTDQVVLSKGEERDLNYEIVRYRVRPLFS